MKKNTLKKVAKCSAISFGISAFGYLCYRYGADETVKGIIKLVKDADEQNCGVVVGFSNWISGEKMNVYMHIAK